MNFKIGDFVKVINTGHIYSADNEMAEKMNLKYWEYYLPVKNGEKGKIVAIKKHEYENLNLLGIRLENNNYNINEIIISEFGVALIKKKLIINIPDHCFEI